MDRAQEAQMRRCFGCGFLAKHPMGHPEDVPWGFSEASETERESGFLFNSNIPGYGPATTMPLCLVNSISFPKELGGLSTKEDITDTPSGELEQRAKEVILKERKCVDWSAYEPGLSPAKHLERFHMQAVEDHRREFEEKMETGRRVWEEQREAQRRTFEGKMNAEANRREQERHTWMMWLALAALFLGLAEVAGTALGLPIVTRALGLD